MIEKTLENKIDDRVMDTALSMSKILDNALMMLGKSLEVVVWLRRNTPMVRLLLNNENALGPLILLGGMVGFSVFLTVFGYMPEGFYDAMFVWGMGWAVVLPLMEVLFVIPTHWWKRRKAIKEGKENYKSIWAVNCMYLISE
jgi:hypothetical protein